MLSGELGEPDLELSLPKYGYFLWAVIMYSNDDLQSVITSEVFKSIFCNYVTLKIIY